MMVEVDAVAAVVAVVMIAFVAYLLGEARGLYKARRRLAELIFSGRLRAGKEDEGGG